MAHVFTSLESLKATRRSACSKGYHFGCEAISSATIPAEWAVTGRLVLLQRQHRHVTRISLGFMADSVSCRARSPRRDPQKLVEAGFTEIALSNRLHFNGEDFFPDLA